MSQEKKLKVSIEDYQKKRKFFEDLNRYLCLLAVHNNFQSSLLKSLQKRRNQSPKFEI